LPSDCAALMVKMVTGTKGAPDPQQILREELNNYDSLFVKQTRRGCLQELFGCEATNEFKIYPSAEAAGTRDAPQSESLYSLEESSCLARLCLKNMRGFTQTVWSGPKEALSTDANGTLQGNVLMTLNKECSLAQAPGCCCCLPSISFSDAGGAPLGSADVPMYCCLPKIKVKDESGLEEYTVKMPDCCAGLCVDIFAEGLCNCKVPFYIYPPGSKGQKGDEVGKIVKIWRGFGTEVFTDADSFQLDFPPGINATGKARLIGTTMFMNMLYFEKSSQQ